VIPEEHHDFLQAVWSRSTPFTKIFLAANILIFVAMEFAGGTTNEATLLAWGVKSNPHIDDGEIWRLITPIFIHIGLLHLFFNSYALWMVGQQVEKLYGSARFVILYILTGVAGVLGSYFYHPEAVSAGASGAIFGLFGVLLVFGLKYRKTLPPFFAKAVGTGVLPVIIINLIIGFSIPAIDNSAHISGLLAGALLAALIPFERPGSEPNRTFGMAQNLLIMVVLLSFYNVAANYNGPSPSFRNLGRGWGQMLGSRSSVQEFIDTVNSTQRTFMETAAALSAGRIDDLDDIRARTAESIDQLKNVPSLGERPDGLTSQLLALMEDQYELVEDIARAGTVTFAHDRRVESNEARYEEIMKSFFEWVESEGEQYGIQLGKKR
jgi:membrane associated rhomboid family serine protease